MFNTTYRRSFMKPFIKYPFALAMLSAGVVLNTEAIRYVWFDPFEPLYDSYWFDDFFEQQRECFRRHAEEYGPSKEDREAIKAAREKMAKVKLNVTEDDQKVTIQLTGFDGLDKKNIKVVKKNSSWIGTVTLKEGTIEFLIGPNGVRLTRHVEVKKEEAKKEDKEKGKERVSYASFLASDVEYFKHLVDIHSAKVEPVKDNTLTLTIQKEKEEVLAIP